MALSARRRKLCLIRNDQHAMSSTSVPESSLASLTTLHARIAAAISGEQQQREAGGWSPVARYLDPSRHAAETVALRRWPLAVAAAQRLSTPGDWLATTAHGVPLLLSRDHDGTLRSFINVCRHRGAALVADGTSGDRRERFVCPYHSWTYATDGRCVGRPHDADFAHAPKEQSSLMQLPCTERFGLVWVVATPQRDSQDAFDWSAYFGPLGDEVESLGFNAASMVVHERAFEQPSNWKLVFDANLESYHFAYAHRNTIASMFFDNVVVHDRYGDHQRIVLPKRSFSDLAVPPATLEGYAKHVNTIYFFFPATFVLWEGDHVNAIAMSPTRVDSSQAHSWLIVPEQHRSTRSPDHWQRNFDIFWAAIDEDYALAANMQVGLASGANQALCFGANEFACAAFHDSVERILRSGAPA
jgi:phenylpropionate dioxygenase-like ring-hydroxylating dioxygenase large terminal subunit